MEGLCWRIYVKGASVGRFPPSRPSSALQWKYSIARERARLRLTASVMAQIANSVFAGPEAAGDFNQPNGLPRYQRSMPISHTSCVPADAAAKAESVPSCMPQATVRLAGGGTCKLVCVNFCSSEASSCNHCRSISRTRVQPVQASGSARLCRFLCRARERGYNSALCRADIVDGEKGLRSMLSGRDRRGRPIRGV